MINYTPGPWHASTADQWCTASGEYAHFGRFDISAGSTDDAAENYYRIASVSNANNAEQNHANANLIWAAPDMLDALRKAAVLLAGTQSPCQAADDAYEVISAAIAKATGESDDS